MVIFFFYLYPKRLFKTRDLFPLSWSNSTISTWNTMNCVHFFPIFLVFIHCSNLLTQCNPIEVYLSILYFIWYFFLAYTFSSPLYCPTHKFSLFLVPIDYIEASLHAPIFFGQNGFFSALNCSFLSKNLLSLFTLKLNFTHSKLNWN